MLLRDRCPKFPDNAETSSAGILSQRSGQMYNPDMGGEGPVSKAGGPLGALTLHSPPKVAAQDDDANESWRTWSHQCLAGRPCLTAGQCLPYSFHRAPLGTTRSEPRANENPAGAGLSRERLMGFEPTTFCMASRRSSQLSYSRAAASIGAPPAPLTCVRFPIFG
jgi:hypothetical protein